LHQTNKSNENIDGMNDARKRTQNGRGYASTSPKAEGDCGEKMSTNRIAIL
jgi:hypothetical protein